MSKAPQPAERHLPAVLAIDGGNSKTDVAIVAGDGTVLAEVRGPGASHEALGMERAMAALGEMVGAAARKAGLAADGSSPVAVHASACLAGADLPEEEEQLGAKMAAQGWSLTSSVANDTFAVLRAGLDDGGGPDGMAHWGVGVTCGAGINCVGVAPDGRTTRFLALGGISGDWGGGGALASGALWWAIRAEDGRGPQTLLREAVAGHFGVAEVRDVAIGLHLGTFSHHDLLGLAPVLFEVAGRGDDVARDVVIRLADEICLMALTAIRRLGLADTAVPVVLGGGVLTAAHPLLTEATGARLAAGAPAALMRIADVPPVAGAALLGLDHQGARIGAYRRLREAYLDRQRTGR